MKQPNEPDWTRTDFTKMTFEQRKGVAERISVERKARNMKQETLARLADVPVRTLSNIENGKTPQAATLRKLADALSSESGKPDSTGAAQMWNDMTLPMYLELSEHDRTQALRDTVLLLGAALERSRTRTENASTPEHP